MKERRKQQKREIVNGERFGTVESESNTAAASQHARGVGAPAAALLPATPRACCDAGIAFTLNGPIPLAEVVLFCSSVEARAAAPSPHCNSPPSLQGPSIFCHRALPTSKASHTQMHMHTRLLRANETPASALTVLGRELERCCQQLAEVVLLLQQRGGPRQCCPPLGAGAQHLQDPAVEVLQVCHVLPRHTGPGEGLVLQVRHLQACPGFSGVW